MMMKPNQFQDSNNNNNNNNMGFTESWNPGNPGGVTNFNNNNNNNPMGADGVYVDDQEASMISIKRKYGYAIMALSVVALAILMVSRIVLFWSRKWSPCLTLLPGKKETTVIGTCGRALRSFVFFHFFQLSKPSVCGF